MASSVPAEDGKVWLVHVDPPSEVTRAVAGPVEETPTASQIVADVHETPVSPDTPLGGGWAVQVCPPSADVDTAAPVDPVPTATQAAV